MRWDDLELDDEMWREVSDPVAKLAGIVLGIALGVVAWVAGAALIILFYRWFHAS